MAAASDAVWAVDLGNASLKALHLVAVGDVVQVIGFDHIPHGKILSSSGISTAEREELVAISLRQFVQRNDIGFDPLIISVPSQSSFARFVTLPPVEAKRLPEIIRFEAAQQIPFDMSEIQWDFQVVSDEESPEKRVGLFAIKNEVVNAALEHFEREELQVGYVQMAPMALYNYLLYDRPDLVNSDKRATMIINIGAETTDLVVCTASGVWQRCILMGGNAFTNAIAESFKLSFEKAEKLKRTAPVSKYARQIFQAMRPVFTDWTGEVQRSLGFYTSSNPDVKVTRVIAMGGGTKLRGLLKYLQQTLQIPVEKPDAYKRLAVAGVSEAKFHDLVSDFGVVYGLGLQGLGMARIESNLLPKSVARSMAWASKMKYFVVAAVMLLAVSLMCLGRVGLDRISYARSDGTRSQIRRDIAAGETVVNQTKGIGDQTAEFEARIRKQVERFRHREVIPELHRIFISALPNAKNDPDQRNLYEAFARGDVAGVMQVPRAERKQVFVTSISIFYTDDLEKAQFRQSALMRRDAMLRESMAMEEMEGYGDMDMYAQYEEIYGPGYMEQMMGISADQVAKSRGFVVTMEGYSPYRDIGALLDPPNVRNDRSRWGFVTRIENIDQFLDVNSPFGLYAKSADHFKLERGAVDLDLEIPLGVGVWEFVPNPNAVRTVTTTGYGMDFSPQDGTWILIDPMTKEPISAKPLTDHYGNPRFDAAGKPLKEIRDYWFRLQFKLLWEDAPETPKATTGAGSVGGYGAPSSPRSSSGGDAMPMDF